MGVRASDLDRRTKAFKGKGERVSGLPVPRVAGRAGFRVLLRSYRHWHAETLAEMRALSQESAAAGLDVSLRCTRVALASGATRHRLDWFIRGEPHAVLFARVQSSLNRVPPPLRVYVQRCDSRAKELNALESVFRYAASQVEMFLKYGTVKVRRTDI